MSQREDRERGEHKLKNVYKNNSKIIQDKRRLAEKARGNISKIEGKIVCECQHLDKNGEVAMRVLKNDGGRPMVVCKLCGKKIDITNKPDSEIDNAIAIIDYMCDVIKIGLNITNDKDADAYKKIAKLQYRTNYQLKALYNQAKSRKGSKKKNNEGGLGNGFGVPVVR